MKGFAILAAVVAALTLSVAAFASPRQCNDGLDNDGDGLIDWPADPGCENRGDNDETDPLPPTATPVPTHTATPTETDVPSPTPTNTAEPTATDTAEPAPTATWPAPTATAQSGRKPKVVIQRMWLLTEQITGRWCVILSETHPDRLNQARLCGWPWTFYVDAADMGELLQYGPQCAGPVYDDDVWACDDDSLRWRMNRWPDADWLHGLGRDTLEVLCAEYPEYCDG